MRHTAVRITIDGLKSLCFSKIVLNIYPLIQINGTKFLNIKRWQGARSTLLRILTYLINI